MTAPRLSGLASPRAFALELRGTPATQADVEASIEAVLREADRGVIAQLVVAPPGAGKTELTLDGVAQASGLHGERVLVASNTRAQAYALARRFVNKYGRLTVTLFVRRKRDVPADLRAHARVRVEEHIQNLPPAPCVVVATIDKLAQSALVPASFDTLFVDEMYQVPAHKYLPVAALATKQRGIGDPGQIEPVTKIDVTRWRDDPAGAHVPAPRVLQVRDPGLVVTRLSVSRRLVADSVEFVQPAFYQDLPFRALDGAAERHLEFRTLARHEPHDDVLHRLEHGASIVLAELPRAFGRVDDPGVAATLVSLAERLLARGAHLVTPEGARPITPADLGIVCAHVEQVGAVQARLPDALRPHVLVETANRFQGLERQVVLVWHPLAGQAAPRAFHLTAGRFCVALSRHRVACILVARAGLEETLEHYREETVPRLGDDEDPEYAGLHAHRTILTQLRALDRVVEVSESTGL